MTSRKQLKIKIAPATRNDKFKALCDFAPVNYLGLTPRGIIREATNATSLLLRVPLHRLIGKSMGSFVARESRAPFCRYQKQLLRGIRRVSCDLVLRRPDGSTFPAEVTCTREQPARQMPGLCHCVITEISDRLRAQQRLANMAKAALRHSRDRERSRVTELETILRTVPIGLAIARDSKGHHIRGNRLNEELFGLPSGAELSKVGPNAARFRVFRGGRELAVSELPMQRAIRGETVVDMELEVLREDGRRVAVLANAAPMLDKAGHLCGGVGTFLDITERKRLERQLLEIGEREQQRISHDLHDGLCQEVNGLAYLARLLERELANELPPRAGEAARLAEVLEHTVELTRNVIRGLQPVNGVPEGLMLTLRELARRTGELYGVDCRFECPKPVLVHNHRTATHLYRIAQEAVNNAIKHAHPAKISIRLESTPKVIALKIRDDGVRGPSKNEPSAGMGLHIMRYRADAIHGNLEVRADPDGWEISCTVSRVVLLPTAAPTPATEKRRQFRKLFVSNKTREYAHH